MSSEDRLAKQVLDVYFTYIEYTHGLGFCSSVGKLASTRSARFHTGLRKFDEGFAFNYNLNWLCLRLGILECKSKSGGDEHQGCKCLGGSE
jgi:hypothetical protein